MANLGCIKNKQKAVKYIKWNAEQHKSIDIKSTILGGLTVNGNKKSKTCLGF